jgi:hypothetical protein
MLKYLRIAVTALSLTACVLLVALWTASHSRFSLVKIQFVPLPDISGTDNRLFGYASASFVNAGGLLWFDLESGEGGYSGPIVPPGFYWRSFEYDERRNDERLQSHFRELPYSLEVARFHVGEYNEFDNGWHLILPHWLATPILASMATLPWLRRARRFSLRTLLIATTLVAVVLGIGIAAR